MEFTQVEKLVYKNFADSLLNLINAFYEGVKYNTDIEQIIYN